MTALIAIAVKSGDGLKPYFLMGAESLIINKEHIYSEDNELVGYEVVSRDENGDKIFEVNDKLLGMTGNYNVELPEKLIRYLKENDSDIKKMSKIALKFVKDFIMNDDIIAHQRCTITMGSCNNSKPMISYIEVDSRDFSKAKFRVEEPDYFDAIPVFAGNTKGTDDLKVRFFTRVKNSVNLNITVVKKAAIEYLENTATRHPEYCNQNIKIKVLR